MSRKISSYARKCRRIPPANGAAWLDAIQRSAPYSDESIIGSWLPGTQTAATGSINRVRAAFDSIKARTTPPDNVEHFDLLSHALGVSCIRAGQIAGGDQATNPILPILILGNSALRRLLNRRRENGVWCFDGPALVDLAVALEQYEEIVQASSPAQMTQALDMRYLALTGAVQESFEMVEALEVS